MCRKVGLGAVVGLSLILILGGCGSSSTTQITLFFGNSEMNPDMIECDQVFPVERAIPVAGDPVAAALEQLFAGPTEEERASGYVSTFSADSASILRGVRIVQDTAYVDLVDIRPLLTAVSSSCGSSAFFAEVGQTVMAVTPVARVLYAIEGDPNAFYEWVQLGCSADNDNCDPAPFAGD